jgi:hypothetical protein
MQNAGWGPQPGYAPAPGGSYEFNQLENNVIGRLGGRAKTWGICSIVVGAIMLILGVVVMAAVGTDMALAVGSVIAVAALQPIVSGGFYLSAGSAFNSVVSTQGNDIPHMMNAVKKLTNAMRIEAIVAIVAIVGGVVLGAVIFSASAP